MDSKLTTSNRSADRQVYVISGISRAGFTADTNITEAYDVKSKEDLLKYVDEKLNLGDKGKAIKAAITKILDSKSLSKNDPNGKLVKMASEVIAKKIEKYEQDQRSFPYESLKESLEIIGKIINSWTFAAIPLEPKSESAEYRYGAASYKTATLEWLKATTLTGERDFRKKFGVE